MPSSRCASWCPLPGKLTVCIAAPPATIVDQKPVQLWNLNSLNRGSQAGERTLRVNPRRIMRPGRRIQTPAEPATVRAGGRELESCLHRIVRPTVGDIGVSVPVMASPLVPPSSTPPVTVQAPDCTTQGDYGPGFVPRVKSCPENRTPGGSTEKSSPSPRLNSSRSVIGLVGEAILYR